MKPLSLSVSLIVPIAAGLFGSGQIVPAQSTSANKLVSVDIQQIAAVRTEWAKTLHEKQIDAAMNLYTDDAIFFSPDGNNAIGKPHVRALYEKVTKAFTSDITLQSISVKVSSLLAYDSGNFHETMLDVSNGATTVLHGSYLMVLARGPDGRFRIVQQMWTNAPANSSGAGK